MLRDAHAVVEASGRHAELQDAAVAAFQPLTLLAMLPRDIDLPAARKLVSSEAFAELARFFLRKGPVLLRQVSAALLAGAPMGEQQSCSTCKRL